MKKFSKVLSLFLCLQCFSCSFFSTVEEPKVDYNSEITEVFLNSSTLNISVGESEYLKLSLNPSKNQGKCDISWIYDEEYLSCKTDNFGAIITGIKAGTTFIKAECNGIISTCMISITGEKEEIVQNPYIYSNFSVIEMQPDNTTTISASLYGGSIEDMEEFKWEIVDSQIADITSSRNNCIISAKNAGSTQIVCSHPDSEYPYTFILFVYTDKLSQTYITTKYNVLTLNKSDDASKLLEVDLVNPKNAAYKNDFTWDYADEESKNIISINSSSDTAEIIPLSNGIGNITVKHPDAAYPLNIVVRVISIVENTYIKLTNTSLSINDSDTYSVTASLENYDDYVNPNSYTWEIPDEAYNICDIEIIGDTVVLIGKKNGIFKIKVSNELCEYSRSILVVLQNQIGSAVDASMYITTDQNYVQTQVGNGPSTINVRLIGGKDGEDNIGDASTNFTWRVKNGRNNGIVEIRQLTGVIADLNNSRSAVDSGDFCTARMEIYPLKAGELTFIVSHPRCLYETEITVKVYPETSPVNTKNISLSTNIIKLLNGNTGVVFADVYNGNAGEENNITWSSENESAVTVSPATGQITQISATGSGSHQTYVTAHLDGALTDKKVLVVTADTVEELNEMKGIYSDCNYLSCYTDETIEVFAASFGLKENDRVTWKSNDSSICTVNSDRSSPNNCRAFITGISEGKTVVEASYGDNVCTFEIHVKLKSQIIEIEKKYITIEENLIKLLNGQSQTVNAAVYNGEAGEENEIQWSSEKSSFVTVSPSKGPVTQITASGRGSHQVYVTAHLNGALADKKILVLTADTVEELKIMKGIYLDTKYYKINKGQTQILKVGSYGLSSTDRVTWTSSDSSICIVNGNSSSSNNTQAYIIGMSEGKADITASVSGCEDVVFEITVKDNTTVSPSGNVKNISLDKSIIKLLNGEQSEVSVSVENGNAGEENSVKWTSADKTAVTVSPASGQTTLVSAVGKGSHQTNVTAHLDGALADKKVLVLSADTVEELEKIKAIYADNTYIALSKGDIKKIYVDKEGLDSTDRIIWTTSNSDVCSITVDSAISNCSQVSLQAVSGGKALITASCAGCQDVVFEVSVKDASTSLVVNPKIIDADASLVKLVNGNSQEITAILSNHKAGEENNVKWTSSNPSYVKVSPSTGPSTLIQAVGSGSHQTYVTAHLDGALSDKKILVLTADTIEILDSMKGVFSDNTYLRISVGEQKTIEVNTFGDFSGNDRITWSSSNSSVCIVNADSSSEKGKKAVVTGISEGKTTISASIGDCEPCIFDITVLSEGDYSEIMNTSPGYLTTNQNTVVLQSVNETADIQITGVNISNADMEINTKWTVDKTDVFEIAGNGSHVTLIPKKPGKATVTVTNLKSKNSIKIIARCGEVYEWTDNPNIYITSDNDVVNIVNGESVTVGCTLVNTTLTGTYTWSVKNNSSLLNITGLSSGTCHITAKGPGQAIILVSNSLTDFTKEILVNISNTVEELKGYKYLTTEQNVITVSEGSSISVNVDIENSDSEIISGYSWITNNNNIAEVTGSGKTAVIYGKKTGTTTVVVTNNANCDFPLEFIVNVINPKTAAENPYISCNNIVTCTAGGDSASVIAELVGGSESDNSYFIWNITDKSIASIYPSNNSAVIKGHKEGVTQIIVSHPKSYVSRSILVICEPKVSTKCYITTTESIIKMKPDDGSKTITATLVNGDADDVYDFKWWADSYEIINMDYTGGSCLIEPISSGTVTIHCSHPKAPSQKDVILYISNYTDFAFESNYVELTTGSSDYFVNMEVPATNSECYISYKSSDSSLCSVSGNKSVCSLHPGTLPAGKNSMTCTVTATLLTKSGMKQAEAELLVSLTKKDTTKPYIAIGSNLQTIDALVDTKSGGLEWNISGDSKNIIKFSVGEDYTAYGKNAYIEAKNSGKAVITVTHEPEEGININPLTIYVIVRGVSDPVVTLNYESTELYIGEELELNAKVQNDNGQSLTWIQSSGSEEFFSIKSNGNKATITPKKVGNGNVTVSLPNNISSDTCTIKIKEPEKIEFFVYTDESASKKTERYISLLDLAPGEVKFLHYKTIPSEDSIILTSSDSKYFTYKDLKYGARYTYNKVTYNWASNVGTIVITGKASEGTANLNAKTSHNRMASIMINNSYNYLFTLDKTVIAKNPKDAANDTTSLNVNYEIRPGNCDLVITINNNDNGAKNLYIDTSLTNTGNTITYNSNQNQYTISSHSSTEDTCITGIKTGVIPFRIRGEVNTTVQIKAINKAVITSGSSTVSETEFSTQQINFKIYYPKHTFYIDANTLNKYPYILKYNNITAVKSKYSQYNRSTNTIFLGDGEWLTGTVKLNSEAEPNSIVNIKSISFSNITSSIEDSLYGSDKKKQSNLVGVSSGQDPANNSKAFNIFHQKDYSIYKYRTSSSGSWIDKKDGIENMYRLNYESDKYAEVLNDSVKETCYVGTLDITYFNYSTLNDDVYKIPVYVNVRNNSCCDDNATYFLTIHK